MLSVQPVTILTWDNYQVLQTKLESVFWNQIFNIWKTSEWLIIVQRITLMKRKAPPQHLWAGTWFYACILRTSKPHWVQRNWHPCEAEDRKKKEAGVIHTYHRSWQTCSHFRVLSNRFLKRWKSLQSLFDQIIINMCILWIIMVYHVIFNLRDSSHMSSPQNTKMKYLWAE